MTKYGTKLTAVGIAKLANAQVTSNKVQITHIAIGDGNGVAYTPTGNETALKRETWRGAVNKAELGTGNTIIVEGIVPATVGGFTMREVGLYDADGDMIAVGNYPETERAGTVDGVSNELILRTLIKVNNASAVDLTINTDLTIATKAEMDVVTQQLAQITKITDDQKSANLGAELITNGTWALGAGWTGDSTIGFTHVSGSVEPLIYPLNALAGRLYEVEFTVESADADHGFKLNVTIADSYPFEIYRGAGNTIVYKNGIEADNNGDLKFIPKTNFVGTIKNISVRENIDIIPPTAVITDGNDVIANEIRVTDAVNNNIFVGKSSGARNTSGNANTSIGHGSMPGNTSGYFNSALGYRALQKNTVGSRNVALAYSALQNNISGHRNIAVGTFALNRNTHGHNNIAVGADTLWYNETGSHNVALGLTAQEYNISGNGNVALGYRTLLNNQFNNFNVAIGYDAGRNIRADDNTIVGSFAGDAITTGKQNSILGSYAMRSSITGERNVAIGTFAGSNAKGKNNVFIGYDSAGGLIDGESNIVIGASTTSNNVNRYRWLNIGNALYGDMANTAFGIGITDPTANLHIKANTAARPLLKFDKGVLTAAKHRGGFEYDGTQLYFTKDDGVRYKITMEVVG